MDILALDLARITGWARGKSGEKPRYGSVPLRKPGEPNGLAPGALGRWLRDQVRENGKPDLIAIEKFLASRAQKSEDQVNDSRMLNGAVQAIAGVYGIEVTEPRVQTVRAEVCGTSRAGGRAEGKQMVIDTLVLRGLLPRGFQDDNAADALAIWVWAESNFARRDSSFALTAR